MVFILLVVAGLSLLGALYWWWSKHIEAEIVEGAKLEWASLQQNEPELLEKYDERAFENIYRLVHFPRFPGYALSALVTFGAVFATHTGRVERWVMDC